MKPGGFVRLRWQYGRAVWRGEVADGRGFIPAAFVAAWVAVTIR